MYLERYLGGDCVAVWHDLNALGGAIREEPQYTDALSVARETMRRVCLNIETLIPRLEGIGYRFGYAELPVQPDFAARQPTVLRLPKQNVRKALTRFEALAGTLPLSLYAWYEQIGEVNFVGRAPESWKPDGFKTEIYERFVGPLPEGASADIYTFYDAHPGLLQTPEVFLDPLQVVSLDDQFVLLDDWKDEQGDYADLSEEEREELGESGGFKVEVSPDADFKFDMGGLGAYEMAVPNLAADAVLLNEWHHATFVEYLRTCMRWAGFPGFEMYRNVPQELPMLTEGLLEF